MFLFSKSFLENNNNYHTFQQRWTIFTFNLNIDTLMTKITAVIEFEKVCMTIIVIV